MAWQCDVPANAYFSLRRGRRSDKPARLRSASTPAQKGRGASLPEDRYRSVPGVSAPRFRRNLSSAARQMPYLTPIEDGASHSKHSAERASSRCRRTATSTPAADTCAASTAHAAQNPSVPAAALPFPWPPDAPYVAAPAADSAASDL